MTSIPEPLPALCPWTPLGDFHPQTRGPPFTQSKYTTATQQQQYDIQREYHRAKTSIQSPADEKSSPSASLEKFLCQKHSHDTFHFDSCTSPNRHTCTHMYTDRHTQFLLCWTRCLEQSSAPPSPNQ